MKRLVFFAAFLFAMFFVSAQTINDPNAEVRNVSGFTGIDVSTGIELILTQGSKEAVAVSAEEEEYRNKIVTEVVNGVLKIYYDDDFFNKLKGNKGLKAYVSIINLKELEVNAGASVNAKDPVKVNELEIECSSGGVVKGEFIVEQILEVSQSSGSVVTLSGEAELLKVKGSSGSIFRGYDLKVMNCEASTNSGSSIEINVEKELDAHASSGGRIHYKGAGVITGIRTNSGGAISKKS